MKKYKKIITGLILALICAILPFVGVSKVKADATIQLNTVYEGPIEIYFNTFNNNINLSEYAEDNLLVIGQFTFLISENEINYNLVIASFDNQAYIALFEPNNNLEPFIIYENDLWNNEVFNFENGMFLLSEVITTFVLYDNFEWISFQPFPKDLAKGSIFNTIIIKIKENLTGLFNVIGSTFIGCLSIFYKNNKLTFLGEVIAWTAGVGLVAISIYVIYRLIKNSSLKLKSSIKVNKDD